MNVLNVKRGRVKSTVTNIRKYVATLNNQSSKEDIKSRLERLDVAIQEFYGIIDQINNSADEMDFDDQTEEVEDMENRYFDYSSRLREALSDFDDENNGNSSMQHLINNQNQFLEKMSAIQTKPIETNLPKINIPLFGGERTQWKTFADYFTSTIHQNPRLTNVQKFHYLRSSLIKESEAERLVQHIQVTEANYAEAWNKLSERYDIKTQIVSSFIKSFIDQPSINQQSAFGIRQLCDKSDEIIRGLRALGPEAESRDNWLVYLIVQKLDPETRKTWCYENANVEFPSFENLIVFLNRQALALEINHTEPMSKSTNIQMKWPRGYGKSLKVNFSNNMLSCPVCNGSHRIYSCETFHFMNVAERNSLVKNKKMCINCLSTGHSFNNCNSQSNCRICHQQHHTMLHNASNELHITPQAHSVQITEISPSLETKNSPCSSNAESQNSISALKSLPISLNAQKMSTHSLKSILPTALIKIKSASGHFFIVRALLDSGSEASFVSESLVKKLGITRNYSKQVVTGIANTKVGTTKGFCTIEIECPEVSSLTVHAMILPKITGMIPSSPINFNHDFANNLNLADPDFMNPRCVDVLIGADHFFDILLSGKLLQPNGHTFAQETVFGWIICGQTSDESLQYQHRSLKVSLEIDIDRTLQRFWELETVCSPKSLLTPDEQLTENHFCENFYRTDNGRFVVRLPFKSSIPTFGNSLQNATNRLYHMERRFKTNENLQSSYLDFMNEYLSMDHM